MKDVKFEKEGDKEKPAAEPTPAVDQITEQMQKLNVAEEQKDDEWSYEKLVDGLKNNKFKRILVMTGAGISVSAGIPDFRTPGSGLYDNLQEYNLPYPEAIFTLDYFLKKPEPFYKFMMHFDIEKYNATPTHYFVKMLHDKKIMLRNLT
mgnify:CR=1 FL=1|jgi:NAD-dependent SIR2 family protein deacetylase